MALGSRYASLVRIEDLDGDPLSVQLVPTEVPGPNPPFDPVAVAPLAGLTVTAQGGGTWLLSYDAVSASALGNHPLTLEASDGTGTSTLRFDLQVVH